MWHKEVRPVLKVIGRLCQESLFRSVETHDGMGNFDSELAITGDVQAKTGQPPPQGAAEE